MASSILLGGVERVGRLRRGSENTVRSDGTSTDSESGTVAVAVALTILSLAVCAATVVVLIVGDSECVGITLLLVASAVPLIGIGRVG